MYFRCHKFVCVYVLAFCFGAKDKSIIKQTL